MYDLQHAVNRPPSYRKGGIYMPVVRSDPKLPNDLGQRCEYISRCNSSRGSNSVYPFDFTIYTEDWDVSDQHCLIMQWKQRDVNKSPCISLEIRGANFEWVIKNDVESRMLAVVPIEWDQQNKGTVNVQWNNTKISSQPPFTIITMNGVEVVNDKEPNMYTSPEGIGPYSRFGPYCWDDWGGANKRAVVFRV